MDFKAYTKPEYYRNRELSWLGFNERVLSEARDKSLPLFERLKFLSITASNLDEFFMIRVASLKDMVHAKYTKPDIAGLSPKEQLAELAPVLREFIQMQYSTYNRSLLPGLKKAGLVVVEKHEIKSRRNLWIDILTKPFIRCLRLWLWTAPDPSLLSAIKP